MADLLRGLRAAQRACRCSLASFAYLPQIRAAEARSPAGRRLFSEVSRSGANPDPVAEGKGIISPWGVAAIGAGAAGIFYYYKQRQKEELETQPHGATGDTFPRRDPNKVEGAAAPSQGVPLPSFEALEVVTGKPASLADLKDDFGLMGLGSVADKGGAKKLMLRIQEVVEGVDMKSNMHTTYAFFVDAEADPKDLKRLVNEVLEENRSEKKGKTELRLKALAGKAASTIKEAAETFVETMKSEGKSKGRDDSRPTAKAALDGHEENLLLAIDPDGNMIFAFDPDASAEEIATTMAEHITHYGRQNASWKATKSEKGRVA